MGHASRLAIIFCTLLLAFSATAGERKRIVGVCLSVEAAINEESREPLYPIGSASDYLFEYEAKANFFDKGEPPKVSLTKNPTHGVIEFHGDSPVGYVPRNNYTGNDHFEVLVAQGSMNVRVRYFVLVDYRANLKHMSCVEMPHGSTGSWKISQQPTWIGG